MQGTELLRDPDFMQTLEQSPFQAKDLPGLSTTVADTFERLTPEQRKELKGALDELDDLSEEELQSFLRMIDYVEKNPDQYPQLVEQLVSSGAFEREDVPEQYNPNLMAVVKALIGQALRRVSAISSPTFAKGGIVSLKKEAKRVQAAGRKGDTMLAHITPFEATMLKRMGGSGTINPKTGLPEYFLKSLGKILKVGAQIIGTIALSVMGVPPIFAGAISGGVTSLLSGAKPADALKSALLGGLTAGIGAGISSSMAGGSFFDGISKGFVSGTAIPGSEMFKQVTGLGGGEAGAAGAEAAAAAGARAPHVLDAPLPGNPASVGAAGPVIPPGVTPTVTPPSGVASLFGKGSFFDTYKMPILLGGGAALLAAGQGEKEEIKPSLVSGPTGTQLLAQQPGTYGFNQANFAPRVPQAGTPVFPGGGYIAPTMSLAPPAPTPNFGEIRFPTPSMSGIMAVKAGGHISGPGHGTSDSIPARLSDGEFVMTAKAVRGAGKGDRMKGARKMYELMNKFERMA